MARGKLTFRQRDLTAAIKGAQAAGMSIGRVEIGRDGKIVIIAAGTATADDVEPRTPPEEIIL
jgi:hypothetical protein